MKVREGKNKPGRQFSQPPEAFFRPGVQLSQEHELWQSVHLILWSSSSRKRKRLFAVGILFASNEILYTRNYSCV